MVQDRKETRRKIFLVLFIVGVLLIGGLQNAYAADDEYYATWEEYQASGAESSTWNNVADAMDAVFDHAIELFESGDLDGAYDGVNDGYYGYYETTGFERTVMGYISGARVTEVELQFSACKAVAKNGGTLEEFTAEIDTLKSIIHEDANQLDGVSDEEGEEESSDSTGRSAGMATFIACLGIIVREGFEAILIVGAIVAYLLKSTTDKAEQKKMTRPVYIGSILGIGLSFVLAWILNLMKLANSASQEIIEGVTALIAVCVLYYVSNWMLSKSESAAWTSYIKSKAEKSVQSGSVMALAFTAFLAVFREGAEVVLFYQPMLATGNTNYVWYGFIVGCVILVFVYLAIRLLSFRIPIKPFFMGTSVLMFAMAISFLGAGIKELIEGDVFTMVSPEWLQWIPTNNVLDVLGIYPTLQTLVPQLLLLLVTIIIFVFAIRRNRRIRAEMEAQVAADAAAAGDGTAAVIGETAETAEASAQETPAEDKTRKRIFKKR